MLSLFLGMFSPMIKATELRLYVLECGYFDMREWAPFEALFGVPKSAVELAGLANPCFLIRNGDKTLLWDAGLPDETPAEYVSAAEGVLAKMPIKLIDQLESLGISDGRVDYLAISHLHSDHVGNWRLFSNSKVLVQAKEWHAATEASGRVGHDEAAVKGLAEFDQLTLLEGDVDVFGDGAVKLILAPGHTPGSQFLVVNLIEYGPVIISGDVLHFREELESGILPTFNFSQALAKESIKKMLQYQEALGAELWIQHDPIQHQERKLSPAYYR